VTLQARECSTYKGYFDISLDGELVLGTRKLTAWSRTSTSRVAFGERPVAGNARAHRVSSSPWEFSGGAACGAFGINFGGVNIAASVTAHGEGRVTLEVHARHRSRSCSSPSRCR
jgi:hypothetical protein